MDDRIKRLEELEEQARSLIRQEAIPQLEPVLRQWEQLLKEGEGLRRDRLDWLYFTMSFYQLDGALYESVGQFAHRQESYGKAWEAAARFAEGIQGSAVFDVDGRYRQMAFHAADFLARVSEALGMGDKKLGVSAADTGAALYDWLWPVLKLEQAPKAHMNGFYQNLECGDLPAAFAHEKAAEEQYRFLAEEMGDSWYLWEGRKARMIALSQRYARTGEGIAEIEEYLEEGKRFAGSEENEICRAFAKSISAMAYAALGAAADQKKQGDQAEKCLYLCCRKAEEVFRFFQENPDKKEETLLRETMTYYVTGMTLLGKFYTLHKQLAKAKEHYERALALLDQNQEHLPSFLLTKVKAGIFLEMGNIAGTEEGDQTQAGFYYSQAAGMAKTVLKGGFDPEAFQTALLGLYGSALLKKGGNPAEAAAYGRQGLELLDQLGGQGLPGWSAGELSQIRKEFEKAASGKKKAGFLSGLFGGKRQ